MNPAVPDLFDILAVIFGILLTVRKLDVSKREASEFPAVEAARFDAWRARTVSTYAWGSRACFLKVVLDFGFTMLVATHLPATLVRVIAATIDLSWVAMMIVTWIRARRANAEQKSLGLDLR